MEKRDVIIYRVITGLFSAYMMFQVIAYFAMYEMTEAMFKSLGVSPLVIYPLAIAKFLGLIAIWTNKSKILKELAYLGFAIDFISAIVLHTIANDGGAPPPAVGFILLLISYIYNRKIYTRKAK